MELKLVLIILVSWIVVERIFELHTSKENIRFLEFKGAVEFGRNHYWILVLLHILFLSSVIAEALSRGIHPPTGWPLFLIWFILAQLGRFWVLHTMKGRWTTRIFVLKGERPITEGPYRYLAHPNYLIVAFEIFSLPMIFGLYWTAGIFSVLNALILLFLRIPEENRALKWAQGDPDQPQ